MQGLGTAIKGVMAEGTTVERLTASGIWVKVRNRRGSGRNAGLKQPLMFENLTGNLNGRRVSFGPAIVGVTGAELEIEAVAGGWAGYVMRVNAETLDAVTTEKIVTYHGVLDAQQRGYWHRTSVSAYDDNSLGGERRAIMLLSAAEYTKLNPSEDWKRHSVLRVSAGPIMEFQVYGAPGQPNQPVQQVTQNPPAYADQVPPDESAGPGNRVVIGAGLGGGDFSGNVGGGAIAPGDVIGTGATRYGAGISRESEPRSLKFRCFVAAPDEFDEIEKKSLPRGGMFE